MKKGSERRKYDKQFKEEAIRLVTKGGRSVPDVASPKPQVNIYL